VLAGQLKHKRQPLWARGVRESNGRSENTRPGRGKKRGGNKTGQTGSGPAAFRVRRLALLASRTDREAGGEALFSVSSERAPFYPTVEEAGPGGTAIGPQALGFPPRGRGEIVEPHHPAGGRPSFARGANAFLP